MCKILEKGLVGLAPRRKAAGFTQYSFADALGCDRGLVAMYETGRAWPSASRLPAMAALLGCSIDDLYELPEDGGDGSLRSLRSVEMTGKGMRAAEASGTESPTGCAGAPFRQGGQRGAAEDIINQAEA